ncbi:LOW QUALITY PROTEIN: tRNA (34-2'-O)-methyltransferase regulator WDR6 [Chiloscyllium punctatum]|uniref:LOW QUALITY PROTEIN: tRNA (34-2'-O)-methyltransferase regulator WDR6 n=1 Tax=Chiloscyllium punctatum TaxID=137246 RepID=UPI003B63797C
MQCESVSLLSPITALQFVGDMLLSGEGASVNLYTLNSANGYERKLSCNVLQNYCVHGIKPWPLHVQTGSSRLAVFGAKGLIVLELESCAREPKLQRIGQLHELHDWIWDLQWLDSDCESNLYFGLALGHNSVVLCDYKARRTLREVHCDVKCILYSACFVGHNWDELILISGTVFNQLVLWRMEGPTNEDGRVQTERRISGHSGVIFSIHYLEKNGVLASASDDRSIRLWEVGNLHQALNGGDGEVDSVQCLLRLYGHQSRVWSVQLMEDCIISIGEDSACIVWNYDGDIIDCFKGHKGRSVRALAVNEDKGWLVTGGADSGIRLWKIQGKKAEGMAITQLKCGEIGKMGTPKALTLADPTLLLVLTDAGSIYSYCLASGQWKLITEDASYQSYGLLAVRRLGNGCVVCAVGNIDGWVKIFTLSEPVEMLENRVHRGKVHSLGWASQEEQTPDECHLFSSGADGIMIWRVVSCKGDRVVSIWMIPWEFGEVLPGAQTNIHSLANITENSRVFLCSAATDGRIVFWDISGTIEKAKMATTLPEGGCRLWVLEVPCLVLNAHQCGVNGLHIRCLDPGRYLLASGGDDNAVRVWTIAVGAAGSEDSAASVEASEGQYVDAGVSVQVTEGLRVVSAHAAHVTGVKVLSPRLLASVSIDQRMTHWELSDRGLRFLDSTCCHVADVADMENWKCANSGTHLYALCGHGLQILRYQQVEKNSLTTQTPNTGDWKQKEKLMETPSSSDGMYGRDRTGVTVLDQ